MKTSILMRSALMVPAFALFFAITGCKKSETEDNTPEPTSKDDKLIFSYDFSNNFRDSGPKGYHLDSLNSTNTSFTTDRASTANSAVQFPGNAYLTLPGSAWKVNFPFTISMWVYMNDSSDVDNRFFESDPITGSLYGGFWIHGMSGPDAGKVAFNFGDGQGTNRNSAISSEVLNSNQWHHIAATYKGYNDIQVYIDGAQDLGATYSGSADQITYTTSQGHIGNFTSIPSSLEGKMDNVRMWGRALSASEIEEEFNR